MVTQESLFINGKYARNNSCMIVMDNQEEIPCTSCQSWNGKQKKFSCNPNQCKGLSEWIHEHASQLSETERIRMQLPETAFQYVV